MWEKQKEIEKFMNDRGWIVRNPDNLAKSITIESSELLEHFQWNHMSKEEVQKDKKLTKEISLEVADIVIYCFNMAVALGFDLESAVSGKLALVNKKYPVKKVKGNPDTYFAIKKAYRLKKK